MYIFICTKVYGCEFLFVFLEMTGINCWMGCGFLRPWGVTPHLLAMRAAAAPWTNEKGGASLSGPPLSFNDG